jgi:hypothetical protein
MLILVPQDQCEEKSARVIWGRRKKDDLQPRGCFGSQKVGARKIARCQFRGQLKILQGANFFEPNRNWMIACTWHVQFHV